LVNFLNTIGRFPYTGGSFEVHVMERRRILRLLSMTAAALWTPYRFRAIPVLEAQDTSHPEQLLPLFPLDLVLLPHTNLPLHIFEPRYKEMIGDCLANGWEFGMLAVQGQSVENIGCTASITKVLQRFPNGEMDILVRGQRRFEISQLNDEKSYLRGRPQFFDDDLEEVPSSDLLERSMAVYDRLKELAKIGTLAIQDKPVSTDSQLSYRLIAGVPAELDWQQRLLELRSERERLTLVVHYFEELIKELESAPDEHSAPNQKIAGIQGTHREKRGQ
jgi:Lon protease-like protein